MQTWHDDLHAASALSRTGKSCCLAQAKRVVRAVAEMEPCVAAPPLTTPVDAPPRMGRHRSETEQPPEKGRIRRQATTSAGQHIPIVARGGRWICFVNERRGRGQTGPM